MRLASARNILLSFIPFITILAIAAAAGALSGVTIDRLTRDVVAIAGIHPFSGILSNLGILLWCVAASICLFTAVSIRKKASRTVFLFLLASALLSGWLMFDDLFLFHEDLARRYLGLSESVVLLALGVSVFAYLVIFRKTLLRTDYALLIVAFGFFAASILVDAIFGRSLGRLGHWAYFVEDGLKWLGISSWCIYYIMTAHHFLDNAYRVDSTGVKKAS